MNNLLSQVPAAREINEHSYEPELRWFIADEYGQRDCVADRQERDHISYMEEEPDYYNQGTWFCHTINGEIEEVEPVTYGLSDDDLDYLTIVGPDDLFVGVVPEIGDLSVLC